MNASLFITLTLCFLAASSAQSYNSAQLLANDLVVLNYALTLEKLEANFYTRFQNNFTAENFIAAGYTNADYAYFNLIRDQENAHVTFLTNTILSLGGTPVANCTYNFDSITSIPQYIGLAQVLETTGTSAYDTAAKYLTNTVLLQAAATVATVEGRHAAYLNLLSSTSPFPYAFENTTEPVDVANAIATLQNCPASVTLPQLLIQLPQFSSLALNNGTVFANASDAQSFITANDLNTLLYALFLENLEAAFYNEFLGKFNSTSFAAENFNISTYNYVSMIRDHENTHVAFLYSATGSLVPACQYNFSVAGPLTNVSQYLGLARVLENTGVSAYDGTIISLTNKNFIQIAATIATVEARHASYLNLLTGVASPFPDVTDIPLGTTAIVNAIAPFLICNASQIPVLPIPVQLNPAVQQNTSTTGAATATTTGAAGATTTGAAAGTTAGAASTTTGAAVTGATTNGAAATTAATGAATAATNGAATGATTRAAATGATTAATGVANTAATGVANTGAANTGAAAGTTTSKSTTGVAGSTTAKSTGAATNNGGVSTTSSASSIAVSSAVVLCVVAMLL